VRREHPYPKELSDEFRKVRDLIEQKVKELPVSLTSDPAA